MYSKDRRDALNATISCLQDMPLYNECQKTLICDGFIDEHVPDWTNIYVPRINNKFCWGRAWDAGVGTARNPKILYLDSDRLLPSNFLERVADVVADDVFVFTSWHFMVLENRSIDKYKDFLKRIGNDDTVIQEPDFIANLRFDLRRTEPYHGPGKNVMSGSTAFTRKTYHRLGGVDHWYCGHGAFADTDFHMQAFTGGCRFVDLAMPEIHYPHTKDNLPDFELKLMGLDNFIYYCSKWKIPLSMAENLALKIGVPNPTKYVIKTISKNMDT